MAANSNIKNSGDKIPDTDSSYLSNMLCPRHNEPFDDDPDEKPQMCV